MSQQQKLKQQQTPYKTKRISPLHFVEQVPMISSSPYVWTPIQSPLELEAINALQYQSYFEQQYYMQQNILVQQNMLEQQYMLEQQKQAEIWSLNNEQISRKKNYEIKSNLFNYFENLSFNNNGIVFGIYLVNKIGIEKIWQKYIFYIEKQEQKHNFRYTDIEKDIMFYNTENFLPQLSCRINQPYEMNIMIHQDKCFKLVMEIKHYCDANGFKINSIFIEDITKQTKSNDTNRVYIESGNVALNKITLSNDLLKNPIIIKIYIAQNISVSSKLNIPKGLYDFEHLYLASSKKDYYEVHNTQTPITTLIENIKNLNVSILPNTPTIIVKGALTNLKSNKIDFLITENYKSDFWITNKSNGSNSCTRCNSIIMSGGHAVLKCCDTNYHYSCLLDEYESTTEMKCRTCNKNIKDPLCKNIDILMSLCGYFE
jgi:hypothetical protein